MYVYDPVLVGSEGAVLLRPGKEGRRSEPEALAPSLVAAGVPVVRVLSEPVLVEGGDTVWLDGSTLLVGIGYRTNPAALPALAEAFPRVEVVAFDLPHWNGRDEVMHLMSLISPLDRDLAVVYPRIAPVRLLDLLAEREDRGRRGAGRGVRDPGAERPRARAEAGARARREPGDAPPHGARGRRGGRLSGRRDLEEGRRRAHLPHATTASHLRVPAAAKPEPECARPRPNLTAKPSA